MKSPLKITQDHVKQVIVDGVFPTHTVELFGVPFTFEFTDVQFPKDGRCTQLNFIERVITCRNLQGVQFVKELPPVLYRELVYSFLVFQADIGNQLFDALDAFLETSESRNYWEIFKHTRPDLAICIVNNRFNIYQRKWILINTQKDKKDTAELITQVFEAAKPWLNSELFARIKDEEQNRRDNAFYDEEDMSKIDKYLRQKAQETANNLTKQNDANSDSQNNADLDEISIEE